MQFPKKLISQSKDIKQKWKGLKSFNICPSVIFGWYD